MGTFRIAVIGHINGVDEWRNIYTVNVTGTDVLSTDIVSYLDALYTTSLLSQLSNKITIDRWVLEQPGTLGKWSYVKEQAYTKVGGSSGDMLPNQMAVVAIGITPSRRRGKKFVPGIVEAAQNQGILDSGSVTIFTTFAQVYTDPASAVPGTPLHCGVCKADGSDFLEFSSFRLDRLLGTQRRRKPGVGA